MPRTRVFISYSHKDREWLDRLLVHLRPLERQGKIDVWADTKIRPGLKWHTEILAAIDSARVAVLLVSADFLASDFIAKAELPPLLNAAEKEGARILPLLISPSRFARTEGLKEFQAVNGSLVSLISLPHDKQEEILDRLAAEIENFIDEPLQITSPLASSLQSTASRDFVDRAALASSSLVGPTKLTTNWRGANRLGFVHTCLTAKGLLDEDLVAIGLYNEVLGPFDAPHLTPEIHIIIHLPDDEEIISASESEFSAVTAICCSSPEKIASAFEVAVGNIPVETPVRFYERQEQVLAAAADALERAFVVAVAVPPTFIRAGHRRPQLFFESMCGIFLVPLIDLHKRLQVKKLHVRVSRVGECTDALLELTKRAVSSVYPHGSWSAELLSDESRSLDEMAKEIVWAVKRLYNMKQDRWISCFQRVS